MKKVVVALTLCFMIAEVNFQAEALEGIKSIGRGIGRGAKSIAQGVGQGVKSIGRGVGGKVSRGVGDWAKGRKTDDGTKNLDVVTNNIRGIGGDLISSGTKHYSYVRKNSLNTASDLSFLVAYSSFAENAGKFLSYFETMLTGIRTEYATLLGAQNRADNTNNEQRRQKQENRVNLSQNNMQMYIDRLMNNEFEILKANLHSSSIILLSVMQQLDSVPDANLQAIQNQINTLNKNSRWNENELFENLDRGLVAACGISGYERPENSTAFEYREELWIKQISLIKDILVKLNSYVQNGDKSGIETILKKMDYYSGDGDSVDAEYAEDYYGQNTRPNAKQNNYDDDEWYYAEY